MNQVIKNPIQCFRNSILFLCFLSLAILAKAQETEYSETMKEYIDAYVNVELNQLSKFYTDESIFQDPTLSLIDKSAGEKVKGISEIMNKLARNFNGIKNPVYQLNTAYTVGDYTILGGIYSYVQNASLFGGPDKDIEFKLRSTTILKELDGNVVEHIDYMDYNAWFSQFNSQTSN